MLKSHITRMGFCGSAHLKSSRLPESWLMPGFPLLFLISLFINCLLIFLTNYFYTTACGFIEPRDGQLKLAVGNTVLLLLLIFFQLVVFCVFIFFFLMLILCHLHSFCAYTLSSFLEISFHWLKMDTKLAFIWILKKFHVYQEVKIYKYKYYNRLCVTALVKQEYYFKNKFT